MAFTDPWLFFCCIYQRDQPALLAGISITRRWSSKTPTAQIGEIEEAFGYADLARFTAPPPPRTW